MLIKSFITLGFFISLSVLWSAILYDRKSRSQHSNKAVLIHRILTIISIASIFLLVLGVERLIHIQGRHTRGILFALHLYLVIPAFIAMILLATFVSGEKYPLWHKYMGWGSSITFSIGGCLGIFFTWHL